MNKIFPKLVLILLILTTLTSCAGNGTIAPPPQPPEPIAETYNIPNVPYVDKRVSGGCLSAAAENVYLYWGENVPQEELFDIIGTNESYLVLEL